MDPWNNRNLENFVTCAMIRSALSVMLLYPSFIGRHVATNIYRALIKRILLTMHLNVHHTEHSAHIEASLAITEYLVCAANSIRILLVGRSPETIVLRNYAFLEASIEKKLADTSTGINSTNDRFVSLEQYHRDADFYSISLPCTASPQIKAHIL